MRHERNSRKIINKGPIGSETPISGRGYDKRLELRYSSIPEQLTLYYTVVEKRHCLGKNSWKGSL
jgi:hypothetical protein